MKAQTFRLPGSILWLAMPLLLGGAISASAAGPDRDGDLGGVDVPINAVTNPQDGVIAIAGNGDIFVATEYLHAETYVAQIQVYRSRDGGDTWQDWGFFGGPDDLFQDPWLHVAEGVVDRCYLACTTYTPADGFGVEVAYIDLTASTPDWTRVPAVWVTGMYHYMPRLTSDQVNYADYNLYLVCSGYDPGTEPPDIYFTRSTDQGQTWEPAYVIGNATLEDTQFSLAAISYGLGGYVHVVWRFLDTNHVLDQAILYRRASGRAAGGSAAWGTPLSMATATDGIWDDYPEVVASPVSGNVMVTFDRGIRHSAHDWEYLPPRVKCSDNSGSTFLDTCLLTDGLDRVYGLGYQASTGTWVVSGQLADAIAVQRASETSPTIWSEPEIFSDDLGSDHNLWWGRLALDPSRGDRAAVHWLDWEFYPQRLMFDAEWLSDPGFPSLEAGFPVDLDHTPISPPALVDLDGDGRLEIVYGDDDGRIQVRDCTGESLPGWPVDTGHALSDGPVAVGALTLDDRLFVVAGTADGYAVAYHADGTLAPGWPTLVNADDPVYVSIGALGGPYPRTVVCCAAYNLTYRDYRGVFPEGATPRLALGRSYSCPAAIGDIDEDGIAEVVVCPSNLVAAYEMRGGSANFTRILPADVSDAPTLGDLDLDGDLEIVAPCGDGSLYVLEDDGTDHPGWPVATASGSPLTSAAIAQILHGYEPDIVWAARDWTVEGYYETGQRLAGVWPWYTTSGFPLTGAPVLDTINDQYSDCAIGDPSGVGWAWTNVAHPIGGWPKSLPGPVYLSPALGDIDQDGSLEVVFLGEDFLAAVDVHNPPSTAHFRWPMYGYDSRRTGCHNCPEDLVTAVPGDDEPAAGQDGAAAMARVSFAGPSPNPMSGPGLFRFAVPVRAAVSLEIYDLRGCRIRTVLREEVGPGEHSVVWDGRDQHGARIAAGQYCARLRVRGPGVQEELLRKIVRLR
jgi:hypothetical protein